MWESGLTTLIAFIALYIAYQQWKTNKTRLIHELFDRRFNIYKITQTHLSYISAHAEVNNDELPEMIRVAQDATFLISEEMSKYLTEIVHKSMRLNSIKKRLEVAHDEERREKWIHEEDELLGWLTDQLPQLKAKFQSYLKLGK